MDLNTVKAISSLSNKCQATDNDAIEYIKPVDIDVCNRYLVTATIAKLDDQTSSLRLNIRQSVDVDRVFLHLYEYAYTGSNTKIAVDLSGASKHIEVRFLNSQFQADRRTFSPTLLNLKSAEKIKNLLVDCGLENDLNHPLVKIIHKLMLDQHLKNIRAFEQNLTCSIQDIKLHTRY